MLCRRELPGVRRIRVRTRAGREQVHLRGAVQEPLVRHHPHEGPQQAHPQSDQGQGDY